MMKFVHQLDRYLGPDNEIRQFIAGAEFRPSQYAMGRSVLHTLETGHQNLKIIEAPTGSGKSMGLGIPAAIYAAANPQAHILISTGTKTLQQQLRRKDIPTLQQMFPTVRFALLQGRDNYLSPMLLYNIINTTFKNPQERQQIEFLDHHLNTLVPYLRKQGGTAEDLKNWWWKNGINGPLSPRILRAITAPPKENLNFESFHQNALVRANQANITIINHAWLASRATHSDGIWPTPHTNYRLPTGVTIHREGKPYLLVDEAHQLPNVLRDQQSVRTSTPHWREWVDIVDGHLEPAAHQQLRRELLQIEQHWQQLRPPEQGITPTADHNRIVQQTCNLVTKLQRAIKDAATEGNASAAENETKVNGAATLFQLLLDPNQKAENYFNAALTPTGAPNFEVRPFDVRPNLAKLYQQVSGTILTSATSLFGSNSHTVHAYGIDIFDQQSGRNTTENRIITLSSPYRLREVTQAFIGYGVPPTHQGLPTFAKYCAPLIQGLQGRTLIIFSSYDTMRAAAEHLEPIIRQAGATMRIQSPQLSAGAMADLLRENPHNVLLGTESLRVGIDIPGSNLSAVVIHKLPFAAPDRYNQERERFVKEKFGGNLFNDYSVPEMTNQLRQAVGRLIRAQTDRGILLITDSRVKTAIYGREAMAAVSDYDWQELRTPEEMPSPERIEQWCLAAPTQARSR